MTVFSIFTHETRLSLYHLFFVFTLALIPVMLFVDEQFKTPLLPFGVVSYEFVWDVETAEAMLGAWTPNAKLWVAFGLGIDYVFMPVYSTAILLGVLTSGSLTWWIWLLASAQYVAAMCDAVENAALTYVLINPGVIDPRLPKIATIFASIKFALLIPGVFVGLGRRTFKNKTKAE